MRSLLRGDLPRPFSRVLVANRGEIAVRVLTTAKSLGIHTVAVCSEADLGAQHTLLADEAHCLGPAPAASSYLRSDAILAVARRTGAEAIHPGYGFLSENAKFATACEGAGVRFIGPPADAITHMGDKSASKRIMSDAGVPVVPGYHGDDQEDMYERAQQVGFPVMLKAVLGGGGKGMRVVLNDDREEFEAALQACKREAMKSFGDDVMLIEKYITRPRHIEFQVFGDMHGNVVHLMERDCSVQRRHQKVLEEAPSPGMTEELRARMGASAVAAARAVGYVGAGTVEFIVDADTEQYYFMEMNTRLQVEHPVTECIVGMDLVQLQLHVAAGHVLPFAQDAVRCTGHAVEARVYSEDPYNSFLPGSGRIEYLEAPSGAGLRVDSGVVAGDEVSIFYDPMISKVICHAEDRNKALDGLSAALRRYRVAGVPTNIEFLQKAVEHPGFRAGMVDTGFIAKHEAELLPVADTPSPRVQAVAVLALLAEELETGPSPWAQTSNFRMNVPSTRCIDLGGDMKVTVEYTADGGYLIDGLRVSGEFLEDGMLRVNVAGELSSYAVHCGTDTVTVFDAGRAHIFTPPAVGAAWADAEPVSLGEALSPMPGKVIKVLVQPGDTVEKGAALVIMEAMKMEHVIRARAAGVVDAVMFAEGDFVQAKKLLVSFQE